MKTISYLLAGMLTVSLGATAWAYVPPTDAQIESILANHSAMNEILKGASAAESAQTVVRTLVELESSTIPTESKEQTAALLYVRALLLSGENTPQFVQSLAGQVDQGLLATFAAASAIAVGGNEGPVFSALVGAAGSEGGNVAAAASNPESALGPDLVSMIQALVIELRGVAAPVIPPPATAPMMLVPPIVPQGVGGALQSPPVATGYVNQ